MGKQVNDLPVFAKILDLFVIVHYPLVQVNVYRTVRLSNHLMSYQLESTLKTLCGFS